MTMQLSRASTIAVLAMALAACTTRPADMSSAQGAGTAATRPASSAECLAANLAPAEPFLASAIPSSVLAQKQNGWVAVRYDVVAGKASNVAVAASHPPGLYDSYVLQHTQRYRESVGKTVRGCIMTVDVKF